VHIEAVLWRSATLVVPLFRTAASGHDRVPAMPPKRAKENILRHQLWNAVLMVQKFAINSSYGKLGGHPPQDCWED
jgi:hypothetical protein